MSEVEFWASTPAKVAALYGVQILQWGKTRDYFTAFCAATGMNFMRGAEDTHWFTAEEILGHKYPATKNVTVTHDPDFGAAGDWQGLRENLRGKSDV